MQVTEYQIGPIYSHLTEKILTNDSIINIDRIIKIRSSVPSDYNDCWSQFAKYMHWLLTVNFYRTTLRSPNLLEGQF